MANILRELFREEGNRHAHGKSFTDELCPDAWFAVDMMCSSTNELPYHKIEDLESEKRKIIFLLESPHIEEFTRDDGPAPANGKTGKFLRSFWKQIFGSKYSDWIIVLVNAVQFQCSLGHSPIDGKIRDAVFRRLMVQDAFKDHLRARVSKIASNEDVIFNACTKGKGRIYAGSKKLNNKECVGLSMTGFNVIDIYHPCSWMYHWKGVKKIVDEELNS